MLCIVMLAGSLSGCGAANAEGNKPAGLTLYYITSDIDSLVTVSSAIDPASYDGQAELLDALTDALSETTDSRMVAPLSEENGFISAKIIDNQVVLDFDELISAKDVITRTLIMAAATRTITQIKGIDSVSGTINGSPMLNSAGMVIGPMSADSFMDNEGLQITAEERTQLTLYFANETGDGLTRITRSVVYSGNIPMDKLVVMQLIQGPQDNEDCYPVIDPNTKLINVTTQDGTCYVNLDSTFLAPGVNVSNDVAIYSIVDSLIELGSVNKVQFLIDSDSDVMFRETVSLNTQFDRNLDIVE
ncbi:MAG: GerMN domain-containing protein [Lachnospiraceae bacterium]|nr:GerMN domain-containing protein [Lachnospiraceae bacterium]